MARVALGFVADMSGRFYVCLMSVFLADCLTV